MTVFALLGTTALASGPVRAADIAAEVTALLQQVQALQAQVATLQTQLSTVQANPALKLGAYVAVNPFSQNGLKGPNIIFQGANIHIESGSGSMVDSTGLGNLVVGYNEDTLDPGDLDANRGGSHNLVVGPQHAYIGSGGIVGGYANVVGANYSSVTGGECNQAGVLSSALAIGCLTNTNGNGTGGTDASSVSGGFFNVAGIDKQSGTSGFATSVSGGSSNRASGTYASVSGGFSNTAIDIASSVSGGESNEASGVTASVSGGNSNTAQGPLASISGGANNSASADHASVAGGDFNSAQGVGSSIGGGSGQTTTGTDQNLN